MDGVSGYALDAQDRSVRDYMAVRDAGGDTGQLFLYPLGSTEKEKTKIWKERRKAEKEAEKKKRGKGQMQMQTQSTAGGDGEGFGESSGKEDQVEKSNSTEEGVQFHNEITDDKGKKESRFRRIMQKLSRNEEPDNIVR